MGKWTKYKKRFSERWEKDEELKQWIERVPDDDTKAFCKFCKKKIRAHRYGLTIHAATDKHRQNEAEAYFSDTGNLFDNEVKNINRTEIKTETTSDNRLKVAKDLIPIVKAPKRLVSSRLIKTETMSASITWPKIVLFGDSLTQFSFAEGGWGAILADSLQRKCDVVNRGFSGYNSRWNSIILPRLFSDYQSASDIAAFVIFLGANDSNLEALNPQQHVPAIEYGENLQAMALHLQSIGIEKRRIIFIGPPPCDTLSWESACLARGVLMAKDNDVVSEYSQHCMYAATRSGAQFIDLYTAMMEKQNWPSFLTDGLHLSKEGSKFLINLLLPRIDDLTSTLLQHLPEWKDIDNHNPAALLS